MIELPYDIIELIMNKKHQLEIEDLKKAYTLEIEDLKKTHTLAINEWEKEVLDLKQQLHELDESLDLYNKMFEEDAEL